MKNIKEVIVVEGKHDTARLKRWFDCDTIETSGTGLNEETLALIKNAKEKRGVIILTDPDGPGERIRGLINERLDGCLNAFLMKEEARTEKKVGVEHAARQALAGALSCAVVFDKRAECITLPDLYELGLCGKKDAAEKRRNAARRLHIGNSTAKTFRKRLNRLGVSLNELKEALDE